MPIRNFSDGHRNSAARGQPRNMRKARKGGERPCRVGVLKARARRFCSFSASVGAVHAGAMKEESMRMVLRATLSFVPFNDFKLSKMMRDS